MNNNLLSNDTIVAVSTAYGAGAISIVRLSGVNAIEIANICFKGDDLTKVSSHTIHYGYIYDNDKMVDEVLVSIFKAPKTYTKEDVVEINCHGGILVTNKILELMIENGARMAEAGEFTKRAFLNGRIDLTKAEAVMDIINSQTERSLKCATLALRGDVFELISGFRKKLLDCILKIEVNIDYPEYDEEVIITNDYLKPVLISLKKELNDILEHVRNTTIINEGVKTAIIGSPNVGKSTLLNALLREEKAIVTDIAGTTRDIVEGKVNLGGIVLNLIDTAGIRETEDIVEKIGVEKTKEALSKAELIILVLDNNKELTDIDKELLELTNNKNRIIVINKIDLESKLHLDIDAIKVSLLNRNDITKIEDAIIKMYNIADINAIDASYISNVRQVNKIKSALNSINDALNAIDSEYPVDLINVDITNAWNDLGEIIGENNPEEMINELFKNFCLGK